MIKMDALKFSLLNTLKAHQRNFNFMESHFAYDSVQGHHTTSHLRKTLTFNGTSSGYKTILLLINIIIKFQSFNNRHILHKIQYY